MREKRIAFILFIAHDSCNISRFIAVLRLKARIMIHHQAALTPKRADMFRVAPPLALKKLEAIAQHKVFKMLLNKGKITKEMIAMLSTWRRSGFHVFCGNRISPNDETAMENLVHYIIRASFSQERMKYLDQ